MGVRDPVERGDAEGRRPVVSSGLVIRSSLPLAGKLGASRPAAISHPRPAADRAIRARGQRDLAGLAVKRVIDQHLAPQGAPAPVSTLIASAAIIAPTTPGSGPSTPASAQLGARPSAGPRERCTDSTACHARDRKRSAALPIATARPRSAACPGMGSGVGEVARLEIVGAVEDQVISAKRSSAISASAAVIGAHHHMRVLRHHRVAWPNAPWAGRYRASRWITCRCRLELSTTSPSITPMVPTPPAAR